MKKIALLFVCLISLLPLKAQEETPANLTTSAYKKIHDQDYLFAIRLFNQAIRINPSYEEAWMGRAEAKNMIAEYTSALNDINQALSINANNPKSYYLRGDIRLNLKDYEMALSDFNKALSMKPEYPDAITGKILAYHFLEQPKEAQAILDQALKDRPDAPQYYYAQGMLENKKERYEKAIESFNKAIQLDPDYNKFNVLLNRGVSYLELKEYDKAEEDLNKAIKSGPEKASAYHSRGRIYYELGDYDQAIRDFNKSIELNPDNDVTYFNLGMTYFRKEDRISACENFGKACSMGNKNACRMVLMQCGQIKQ